MKAILRSALVNMALVSASILVALALAEGGLRILGFSYVSFHRPDALLGFRPRENAQGWQNAEGNAFVQMNSAGFRDRERALAKPKNTFRIAVLGDSYAEAMQVNLDETFQVALERSLSRCVAFKGKTVEVLNFGVSGYGTAQELLTFRHIASKYSPDLVLLAFYSGNDVRNNSRELEPEKIRPFFYLNGGALVEDRTFAESEEFQRRTNRLRAGLDRARVLRVVQVAYFIKDRLQQRNEQAGSKGDGTVATEAGLDGAVYGPPKTVPWRDAWAVTERLIVELDDEVRAAGAELLVVVLSTGIQVNPDPAARAKFMKAIGITDIFYPDHRVETATANRGIRSILLAPTLQAVAERDHIVLHGFQNTRMGTGHWNTAGHRVAAEIMAARICADSSANIP